MVKARGTKLPSVTVDVIIFTIQDADLKVLLIKRSIPPFKNSWALPGGFVNDSESLEQAAKRKLVEEAGIKDVYLEQLYTFGDPKRDPRQRIFTVAYFALVKPRELEKKKTWDVSDIMWCSVKKLPKLAFDHKDIIKYAIQRLRWKLEYTTIGFQLLSEKFTLTQLQDIYEIILAKQLDKRNFRKKVLALNLVKETKEKTRNVSHRPAQLYRLNKKIGEIIEIL